MSDAGAPATCRPLAEPEVTVGLGAARRIRALFDEHFDFIWRLLARHGVAESDLDDAVQQVFLVLTQRTPLVIHEGSERAFLFGIALRVAQTYHRSHRRRREVAVDNLGDALDEAPRPDELTDHRRARAALDRILEAMPMESRAVFVLFELEQLTMAEIAAALAIPPGTVASRLRRARALFQMHIGQMASPAARGGQGGGPCP